MRVLALFLALVVASFSAEPPSISVLDKTVTITVNVASTTPVTYVWYKNTTVIAGANTNSITVPTTTAGTYYAVITNSGGTVTSGKIKIGTTTTTSAPEVALTFKK